jgi:hypothetical protein
MRHDLGWIVALVADERGMTAPPQSPAAQCMWLGRHADWLAAHPDAAVFKDVVGELVGRAYGVIDPSRLPVVIGACIEQLDDGQLCEGTLKAIVRRDGDLNPSEIYCDVCPLQLDTTQWHRFGRRYLRAQERVAG